MLDKHRNLVGSGPDSLFDRWRRDDDGGITIMFAFSFFTMLMFVASAVDLSRWVSARSVTQAAVDAAVLADARASNRDRERERDRCDRRLPALLHGNTKDLKVVYDSIDVQTANNNMAMQAKGQSYVETPFLALIGIDRMPLFKATEAAIGKAVVASSGRSDSEVEISMLLDITALCAATS